jgi:hypothetical protein
MFTKTITNFKQGMTPNLYGEGIVRIEHFDNTTEQARPYRKLIASPMTGVTVNLKDLSKFALGSTVLYALGKQVTTNLLAVGKWNTSTYGFDGVGVADGAGTFADILFWYKGSLYGLWKADQLWKMTTAGAFTATHQTLAFTTYAQPIVHSKSGTAYWATNNVLSSFDGTTIATVHTYPTNFVITCIAEKGDFIQVIGYDSQTLISTSYLWDRDSSISTDTQKYELYNEVPYHNVTLGGTHFIITTGQSDFDTSATASLPNAKLNIRYILGDDAKLLKQFQFSSIVLRSGAYFVSQSLYFHATVKFLGDTDVHFVVFQLTENGELVIAQNLAINDSGSIGDGLPGLIKIGTTFFIAGRTDGSWHTISTYPSTASEYPFFETPKYSSPNFTEDIDVLGYTVTFEPLASGASVVVKTRADAETAWTPLATFAVDDSVQGAMTGIGTNTVAERQFRIESIGGATITGFSVTFNGVANSVYHYATK